VNDAVFEIELKEMPAKKVTLNSQVNVIREECKKVEEEEGELSYLSKLQ